MASVEVKVGFLVLLVAAAFVVGGTAELEWCDYVVDVEIPRGTASVVKFEVSNAKEFGDIWTRVEQVRDDPPPPLSNNPPPPPETCVNGGYQFVSKNLCKDPCHLSLQVLSGSPLLPVSVRIRGYPSQEQNTAKKYDHLFFAAGFAPDINHC